MDMKQEITFCLNNMKRVNYWKGSCASKLKVWGEFLKARKKEGKIQEYKEEVRLFTEYLKLKREWWDLENETKAKFQAEDFGGKESVIILPKNFKSICKRFIKEQSKHYIEIDIFECYKLKQSNPSLGLRKLADKFGFGKDTISKWLRKGEELSKTIPGWEEQNQLHYEDKLEKELDNIAWTIAQSKGVRKEDFPKWCVFHEFQFLIEEYI